jgi:tricorn protease
LHHITAILLIICASVLTAFAQDISTNVATFPRHPGLSPDGSRLAFDYDGDIWTVSSSGGEARRVTVNPAHDHSPKWSPDAKWIAFSSNRGGDDDLFVIPAEGGAARQLTFIDVDDQVCDWTPDSKSLLFTSSRDDRYPDFPQLFRVSLDGGEPERLFDAFGGEASISDDGSRIVFTRSAGQWWRKGYRSSGAAQVWLTDLKSNSMEAVTDTSSHKTGDDFKNPTSRWPQFHPDGGLLISSERDGTPNLWHRSPGGAWSQVTSFKGDGVRFPSLSHDGGTIAFERDTRIWVIAAGSKARPIEIIAPIDPEEAVDQTTSFSENAVRAAFSPDGQQMLVEVRGEVVAGRIVGDKDKAARGRANVLSSNNPARDGDMIFSVGGDSAIAVSDRSGSRDLYLLTSTDPETKELARAFSLKWDRLTKSPLEEHTPRLSPDGKSVAFIRGAGDLVILDLESRDERVLLKGWSLLQYNWSPDGKWIAFAREDDEYNSDVFVIPSTGGKSVNISRHPDEDEIPVWSKDGKKLAFRSRRRENNWDIYTLFLKLEDDQLGAAERAEQLRMKEYEKKDKDKAKEDSDKKKKDPKDDTPPEQVVVVIDTTDIHLRIRSVTQLTGEEGAFDISPDGEKFVFTANHEGETDLYSINWDGTGIKRLTNGGANPRWLSFDPAGKRIRYLDGGGRVKSIDADGGAAKDHPFDVKLKVNALEERRQKFNEVWRRLNLEFYDPKFHGRDWNALHDKYLPWAEAASCEQDFGDVVKLMMGELNSSHMGYYSPDAKSRVTGRLGLDFDEGFSGEGLRISHIVKDGPCDKETSRLLPGDILKSVAGIEPGEKTPIERILEDQVGQRIELIVKRGKEEKRFVVRPIHRDQLGSLRYSEWIEERRRMVDSLSDGRLGYLHIRGMAEQSLAKFETELYSIGAGKDGLVVDVRYNGGGWTADWLLAMLQVKRHATTFPRDGGPGYPQSRLPLYSWVKPIVALCNEHSFSNAEIFSHAVQTLGRGKLVGVPTPGGVISTGGDGLLDGSSYRIPLRGWFIGDNPTQDPSRNMEGNGAIPDMIVPMKPGMMAEGKDTQLQAAVESLLADLKGSR